MTKALFFDIDGTLVSFKSHRIPQSTVEAISAAKDRGVEVYISTGRPYAIINNIDSIVPMIDGYITTNGAYCFIGDKVISCSPIDRADVDALLRKSSEMNFATIVVGEKDLTIFNPNARALHIFKDDLKVAYLGEDVTIERVLSQPILQLTPFITKEQESVIMPYLHSIESGRWHPEFVDLTARGVSKAKGLSEIAAYRDFDISETMAFGDGGNDLTIVEAAGIGVAMGNANEILKPAADYVTTSVDDNGVMNALLHYNVI